MTFPTTPAEVAAIDKTTNLGRGLWLRVRGGKYRSWAVRLGGKWAKTVAASKLTPAEAREMAEALLAEHEKNRERRRKEEALARMQADSDRAAEMGLLDGDQPDGDPVLARLLLRNVGEWIGPEDKGRLEAEAAARPAPSTGSGKPLGDFVEEALANIDRKNASDRRAMRSCLERYAGALLEMPIGTIRPKHVARVLRPLMAAGRKGAARNLRSALSPVFTFAVADDAIDMSPMGDARVLDALLPNKKVCGQVRHRVAVPLDRAPAAFAGMVEPVRQDGNRDAVAAARFMVLTAARPIEAARAVAGDFDLNAPHVAHPGGAHEGWPAARRAPVRSGYGDRRGAGQRIGVRCAGIPGSGDDRRLDAGGPPGSEARPQGSRRPRLARHVRGMGGQEREARRTGFPGDRPRAR